MLIRKILRDVWKNKVPFISIFLMMLAGNFIFSGITSEYNGLNTSFHAFIQETSLADAWVMGKHLKTPDIDKLKNKPNITAVEQRLQLSATLPDYKNKSIDLYVLDHQNSISKMKLVSGTPYEKDADGLWLDDTFAQENHYKLHDKIKLEINGQTVEKEIIGLCYSPEYIYHPQNGELLPDHKNAGFAFVNNVHGLNSAQEVGNAQEVSSVQEANSQAYKSGASIPYNQLLVTGTGNLKKTIYDTLGANGTTVLLQKDHPSYSMVQDKITQQKEIGLIFTAVFLFIAVLITITTVHRLLNSQRMQIGILKALGFHKRKLYLHYVSHSTFVCLLGAFIGWGAGYIVLPDLIFPIMKKLFTLPELEPSALKWSFTLPILCALASLLLSLVVCRKYLRSNAARILYANSTEIAYKELPLSSLNLSFYGQWNIREIYHNKLRSIMTILGVIGCVALLFSSFGLHTTLQNMSEWTFHKMQTFETKVTGTFSNDAYKNKLLKAMNGEELMETSIEINFDSQKKAAGFTGIDGQKYLHLYETYNKEVAPDKGIALSRNIAKELNIHVGDQIEWKFEGHDKWYESTVKEIIRTPLLQGITMTKEEMDCENIPFQTTSIIGMKPTNISVNSDYVSNIQSKSDLQVGMNTMLNASVMISTIFLTFAILLGSVILYNLGTLSYMERYRDMATLKVLGFHNMRIRKLMVQQNLWLTIVGIIIGLPVGYGLTAVMVGTMQKSVDLSVYAPIYIYAISLLGTFLLSWFISRALARKVSHIDMVSALKINE